MVQEPLSLEIEKITKLLSAYNRARLIRQDSYVPMVVQKTRNYKSYDKIIKFFEKNAIEDWFLFFYCLFRATKWQFIWSWNHCYTEKALRIYNDTKAKAQEELGMLARVLEANETQKSEWIDTFSHIEDIKERLLKRGQEIVCKSNKEKYLGFNPKSNACINCSMQSECAQELISDFKYITNTELNIIDIRNGVISREHANMVLELNGNNLRV